MPVILISTVLQKTLYILLAALYAGMLIFIFCRVNRKKGNLLPWQWIAIAFLAKAAAGMVYGYIYSHYYTISDSWVYFKESLGDYHDLIHDPAHFFSINSDFRHFTGLFSTSDDAFWSNAGENILIKLLGMLNVFSNGNYYIDVILFNAFSFWGLYLIYRVAVYHLPGNNGWIYLLIFFWPSCLFWNSAIDKDGLMIYFTGILISSAHNYSIRKKAALSLLLAVVSFAGILLMRNVNALIFVPAIIAWWITSKIYRRYWVIFAVVYGVTILVFFLSGLRSSSFNLPQQFAGRQHQFLSLEASTRLPLTSLEPTLISYIKVFPEAVNHIFFRPYITEITSPFHAMMCGENIIFICIIFFSLSRNKYAVSHLAKPFNLFLCSFSLSGLLLIGYIVPFPGAIIRYKAFYTMIFLLPFVGSINKAATIK
ncbi:MAG: hypothetical protein J0H29_08355 [Sphingobacteriales bacterium]|nr:hypothetical protein [Sphingobacteriales bacterium]OJY81875.1 MAG: hypothetical protein BGP14_03705 [Sphingobacteriales bacterium 44-15]